MFYGRPSGRPATIFSRKWLHGTLLFRCLMLLRCRDVASGIFFILLSTEIAPTGQNRTHSGVWQSSQPEAISIFIPPSSLNKTWIQDASGEKLCRRPKTQACSQIRHPTQIDSSMVNFIQFFPIVFNGTFLRRYTKNVHHRSSWIKIVVYAGAPAVDGSMMPKSFIRLMASPRPSSASRSTVGQPVAASHPWMLK